MPRHHHHYRLLPHIGDKVVLDGLDSERQFFNGKIGTIDSFLEDHGRYRVILDDNQFRISVQLSNIVKVLRQPHPIPQNTIHVLVSPNVICTQYDQIKFMRSIKSLLYQRFHEEFTIVINLTCTMASRVVSGEVGGVPSTSNFNDEILSYLTFVASKSTHVSMYVIENGHEGSHDGPSDHAQCEDENCNAACCEEYDGVGRLSDLPTSRPSKQEDHHQPLPDNNKAMEQIRDLFEVSTEINRGALLMFLENDDMFHPLRLSYFYHNYRQANSTILSYLFWFWMRYSRQPVSIPCKLLLSRNHSKDDNATGHNVQSLTGYGITSQKHWLDDDSDSDDEGDKNKVVDYEYEKLVNIRTPPSSYSDFAFWKRSSCAGVV